MMSKKQKESWDRTRKIKSEQLGMDYGTAMSRLKKMIVFDLVVDAGKNICFRCGEKIETPEELSFDHIEPWMNVDVKLFWDRKKNMGFSHYKCNVGAARHAEAKHGTVYKYEYHKCRCDECKKAKAKKIKRLRKKIK